MAILTIVLHATQFAYIEAYSWYS